MVTCFYTHIKRVEVKLVRSMQHKWFEEERSGQNLQLSPFFGVNRQLILVAYDFQV